MTAAPGDPIIRSFFICAASSENGDTKGSLELQLKYLPLVNLLFSEVNPIPVKTACKLLGFAAGPMRLPLTDMEPEHAELLAAEMRRLGIIK